MTTPDKTFRQRVLLESDSEEPPTITVGKRPRVLLEEFPITPVKSYYTVNGRIATRPVSNIEERFLHDWVTHYNDPGISAKKAGYPVARARELGYRLLSQPRIQQRLQEIEQEMLEKTSINAEQLFREIVTANLRLARAKVPVQLWVPPCRYCYGENNEYQRTVEEMATDLDEFLKRPQRLNKHLFDKKGGDGYDTRLPPYSDCPNCHGEGDHANPIIRFKDSRFFTPEERELWGGVRYTKSGIETIWRDQAAARSFLGDLALRMAEYRKPDEKQVDLSEMTITQLRQLLDFAKDQGFDVDLENQSDESV